MDISDSEKPVVNLLETGIRKLLSKRIKEEIDEYAIDKYNNEFRWHLGASIIGEPCKRAIWYSYRWVLNKKFEGRMSRLLQRGNLEEFRYIEYLNGLGFQIWQYEIPPVYHWDGINPPIMTNKGKQYTVSFVNGHFGGSMDAVIKPPTHYNINDALIAEFKTNGTGRGFNDLLAEGVQKAKLPHYIQMCIYGYGQNINYGAYFNTNKNDDDMHIEIVNLDHSLAEQMIIKAEQIIFSEEPPAKISENPTYDQCKIFCNFKEVCHVGKPAAKNCRSCGHCMPAENAEFFCYKENSVIPRDIVKIGCNNYKDITNNKIISIVSLSNNSTFEIENVPLPK